MFVLIDYSFGFAILWLLGVLFYSSSLNIIHPARFVVLFSSSWTMWELITNLITFCHSPISFPRLLFDIYACIFSEGYVIQVLETILMTPVSDFIEDAVELIVTCTSERISQTMWSAFAMIYEVKDTHLYSRSRLFMLFLTRKKTRMS